MADTIEKIYCTDGRDNDLAAYLHNRVKYYLQRCYY